MTELIIIAGDGEENIAKYLKTLFHTKKSQFRKEHPKYEPLKYRVTIERIEEE